MRSTRRMRPIFSLLVTFIIPLTIPLVVPQSAAALELNEMVIERSGEFLTGSIRVDSIADDESNLQVGLAQREVYDELNLEYSNVINELEISYTRINRRNGRIEILFPYQPVDAFNLLVAVNWDAGQLQRRYRVALDRFLPQGDGEVVARISPVEVPLVNTAASSSINNIVSNRDQDTASVSVEIVSGDTWQNLALAIRQAYFRDETINQEQIMLALLNKNPESFIDRRRLRIGGSLILPNFNEVASISASSASREIAELLGRPRLQLAAARDQASSRQVTTITAQDPNLAAEEVDVNRRELGELTEELNLVREQREQVDQLIELQSQNLAAIQQQADNNRQLEAVDIAQPNDNDQLRSLDELLKERLDTFLAEIARQPIFWAASLSFVLLSLIALFWLRNRLKRSRVFFRSSGGQASIFDDEVSPVLSANSASSPASNYVQAGQGSRGAQAPTRRDGFINDDLTNANLDLARAYINMGEEPRARGLLEEVIKTGTSSERDRAQRLLRDIS